MSATVAIQMPVNAEARAQAVEGAALKGLPTWYFPLVGLFAGIFDIARAYPVLYALIPVVAVVQIVLSTVAQFPTIRGFVSA
ncbi:hypothetical protein [Streptomyces sp. NBC_01431]|uniref:hypothetical protein n=1 Tax=Streptomyces sp. NBC_01431 TaxID=2903863 RepID=UPI002E2F8A32|nr:hypothetical protein [Streptomyces sp. NBC_01431]